MASLIRESNALLIYLPREMLPLAAQCRSLVVVAMINVRARTRTSRWRSEGGQCRGAFAAASSILTGALLLIHQRREGERGRRQDGKEGGRGNKGTLAQFIWRANTTLAARGRGDRPVEFSPPPPLRDAFHRTDIAGVTLRSRRRPRPSASLLSVCQL